MVIITFWTVIVIMYFAAVFDIGEDREDPILILRIEIGIVI